MSIMWQMICKEDEIPLYGARTVVIGNTEGGTEDGTEVALFKLSTSKTVAIENKCPHKGGPLSMGIVSGKTVLCPLHNTRINLINGSPEPACDDMGTARVFEVKSEDGMIWLKA